MFRKHAVLLVQRHCLLALVFLSVSPVLAADVEQQQLIAACMQSWSMDALDADVLINVESRSGDRAQYSYVLQWSGKPRYEMHLKPQGRWPALIWDASATRIKLVNESHFKEASREDEKHWFWLFDLALLMPDQGAIEHYKVSSQYVMAAKQYITLVALFSTEGDQQAISYAKKQFSFVKTGQDGWCKLLRAAYFDHHKKISKKIFFHWQKMAGRAVWDKVHIEDTRSLSRVGYKFSGILWAK